jgi:hypothetical protein
MLIASVQGCSCRDFPLYGKMLDSSGGRAVTDRPETIGQHHGSTVPASNESLLPVSNGKSPADPVFLVVMKSKGGAGLADVVFIHLSVPTLSSVACVAILPVN